MDHRTADLLDDLRDSSQGAGRFAAWVNQQPTEPAGTDDEVWLRFLANAYGVAVQ